MLGAALDDLRVEANAAEADEGASSPSFTVETEEKPRSPEGAGVGVTAADYDDDSPFSASIYNPRATQISFLWPVHAVAL